MKKLALGLLLSVLASLQPARAQTTTPVGYSERVPDEGVSKSILYRRAYDWAENHFIYTPKSIIQADTTKGEVRIQGSGKVKTASPSGQLQERPVQFEFVFHTLPNGYDYRVGSFRLIPDPSKPDETIGFDEFVAQLATERSNARTHNDRRVTAQATSLASEVALSFHSYMNSRPAEGAVE